MKMIRFHPEAEAEMVVAASYYESQQENLGKRLLASVQDALNRIQVTPLLYPIVEADIRRCLTTTFPFGILFRDLPGEVLVIAVMHLHRDPDYCEKPGKRIERLDKDRCPP
jgi:cytochrome P450